MKRSAYLLAKNPLVVAALLVLAFWVLTAIFGPSLISHGYAEMDMDHQMSPPLAGGHALGTDALGRDILARIVYGSRSILTIALLTSLLSSVAGVAIGFSAGYSAA
jgi:peptide/nickel transport system permease protein